MADLQLYDKLLQFPLFLGMSRNDLMQTVAHTRFDFLKLGSKKRIVKAGEVCHHLFLLTDGSIKAETASPDGGYRMEEYIQAPFILQPERIVGVSQRFTTTFTTLSECHLIAINKKEVVALTERILVFRLNLLGLFATRAQKLTDKEWDTPPSSLRERITQFLRNHCVHPEGNKRLFILMQRLALELNDSRLNVSRALNEMQEEGYLTLSRGCITVRDMAALR